MTFKSFAIQVAAVVIMTGLVLSLHYIPNSYCMAAFNLPCDITQGR